MIQPKLKLFRDQDVPAKYRPAPAGAGGGGKGGGGGGRTPVEDPDTLQSSAFASVLDVLSCGPIKGLVNGMESIFLDNVPLRSGVTDNFSGVVVEWRNGTQSQPYIPGFPSAANTTQMGLEIRYTQPALAAVTNPDADAFSVTVAVGALSKQSTKTGDVSGSSVELFVEYQPTNSGWLPAGNITITGKTRSRYQETHRYELTGEGPWNVRVTRLTPDSNTQTLVNPTYLDYISTLIDEKLRFPNTAIVGIKLDARQFSNVPTRSYEIEGMIIRVPNNYDPDTRTYTGPWNGGFKSEYSNNPAWCLYEMLTNPIFGLGNYMDANQFPKDILYTIGQYCDELVPDGFGGMEPRFTLNCVLQGQAQAYKLVQDLCSVFRGMTYWGGGLLVPVIDMPKTPIRSFSPANAVNGDFVRTGSDRMARHSVALITWNNPEDLYRQATEYVEDKEALRTMGYRPTDAVAFGCTSRGQANRLGKWILASERLETDQWAWGAGQEAATLLPGDIVRVTDPVYAGSNAENPNGVRMGGRVLASSRTTVTLDAPIPVELGVAYTLYYMDATGTDRSAGVINEGAGQRSEFRFVAQRPEGLEPQVGDVWAMSAVSRLEPALVRVLSVKDNGKGTYDVIGTTHAAQKFAEIDYNTRLEPPPTGLGNGLFPNIPTNFSAIDTTFLAAPGVLGLKLFASWTGNTTAYVVRWRVNGGAWVEDVRNSPSIDIPNVTEEDVYDFRIWGLGADGARSTQPLESTYTIMGKSAPPGPCTNLTVTGLYKAMLVSWVPPDDLDLDYVQVLESEVNDVATATLRGRASTTITVPVAGVAARQGRYYWVRAVDTSGNVGPLNSNLGTYGETIPLYTSDFEGEINEDQLASDVVDKISDKVFDKVEIELTPVIIEDTIERVRGITVDSGLVTSDQTTVFAGTRSVYSDTVENDRAVASAITVTIAQLSQDVYATIAEEKTARVSADEALAIDYRALVAQLGDDLTAAIANEATARANADMALASVVSTITTQFSTDISEANAAIVSESSTRSSADEALALQITTLQADFDSEIASTNAAIQTEATARANADSAIASTVTTLAATVETNDTEVRAAIQTESTARADADSALSTTLTTLSATVNTNDTDIRAALAIEATTRANADGALSQLTTSLGVRVGDVELLAEDNTELIAEINGAASATRTIKLQQTVGGITYAASMGLGVYNNGGAVQTSIYFQADRFALLNVINGWTTTPFIIDNGVTYMDTAMIKDATIGTAKITNASITNAKIQDASITAAKIIDAQITNAKIADANITTAKIGFAQIDTLRIAAGAVVAGSASAWNLAMGSSNGSGLNSFTHTANSGQGGNVVYFCSTYIANPGSVGSNSKNWHLSTGTDGTIVDVSFSADLNASPAFNEQNYRAFNTRNVSWVGGAIGAGNVASMTLTMSRPSDGVTTGSVRMAIFTFQR